MGQRDPNIKRLTTIDSVPLTGALTVTTPSIPAGLKATIKITTLPDSPNLSLWEFYSTVLVDTADIAYAYPDGTSLTSNQRSMRREQWSDWLRSDDTGNVRVHYIRIENTDTGAHTYTVYFKAYTTVGVGSSAS